MEARTGGETGGYLVPASPWAIYVTADFIFSQAGISSQQVQQAIGANPQIPSLLTATSGKAKYYSTTAGPTFRRRVGSVTDLYATAGFGWLRRTVDFSGAATEGSLLQPSSQGVAGISGNSGAFDVGVGWSRRLFGGFAIYAEARVLHGLAINHGTTLCPISAGIRW